MTGHLLLVSVGPVQEFIAQARRTRDLWYGSHLLSELSRAAARALVAQKCQLVFPALEQDDAELTPCVAPLRASGTPPLSVANKLLAEVPAGADPEAIAKATRAAIFAFWKDDIASRVRKDCAGLLAAGSDAVWNEQIGSFLEFAATWAPSGPYASTRRELERALGARKNLRDFSPFREQLSRARKSSLDGARQSVLRVKHERDQKAVRKYRIAPGEELDAVGLVKRAGGDPDQFVPVVNIALSSWIARAEAEAPRELVAVRQAALGLGLGRVARKDLPCTRNFPVDASVLLPSRWRSLFAEVELDQDGQAWGTTNVSGLLKKLTEPWPYVACLVADGDRMGRALDVLAEPSAHRAVSRALAGFAAAARSCVEQEHRGALIYAGGDDVLAFLPVAEALVCAATLRSLFEEKLAPLFHAVPSDLRPTLSVGIGIGHCMESMGELLSLGRRAEQEAKRDRNALALIVDKRSGGERHWRASWATNPVERLRADAELMTERLSSRKVYEVARTLSQVQAPTHASDERWSRLLVREVERSLSRVDTGALSLEEVGLDPSVATAGYRALHSHIQAWVDRMLIARELARATPRVRGQGQECRA